jgi:hypothetical protein
MITVAEEIKKLSNKHKKVMSILDIDNELEVENIIKDTCSKIAMDVSLYIARDEYNELKSKFVRN